MTTGILGVDVQELKKTEEGLQTTTKRIMHEGFRYTHCAWSHNCTPVMHEVLIGWEQKGRGL